MVLPKERGKEIVMEYIKSTRIYTENGCINGLLAVNDGRITQIYRSDELEPKNFVDYGDNRIIPGIIDIHNHGFKGHSMRENTTEATVRDYLKLLTSVGVTGVLPAGTEQAFGVIAALVDREYEGARILGIHSEGPFFAIEGENSPGIDYPLPSVEQAEKMIAACNGALKLMAIAPEVDGAYEVIRYLNEQGVLVAAAHTMASAQETNAALMHNKIDLVTHLGNAMRGIHHREVGALGAFLLNDNLYYEVIADLNHVCADMLRIMFRLQPYDKFILVSDSNSISGLGPGQYEHRGRVVHVDEKGLIIDEHGCIGGSGKHALYGLQQLIETVKVPADKAIRMASLHPAKLLEIADRKGSIAVNKDLDIVVIDDAYEVIATYVNGDVAYAREAAHP